MISKLLKMLFEQNKKEIGFDSNINYDDKYKLKDGEKINIRTPEIDGYDNLKLTKWFVKNEDFVYHGMIICELSNKHITFENETFYSGNIELVATMDKYLETGDIIFKLHG